MLYYKLSDSVLLVWCFKHQKGRVIKVGLQKIMAGGIVGLLMTYMSFLICDTLFTGGSDIEEMIIIIVPLTFGLATVMYVLVGAFKGQGGGG